ncbi:protein AE7 [Diplogelasinospora grovesii]|uniref:Protein AE7 n=1 Tax=Diplogelasinospora grovesii TaxID=303347 RepID=A0AAN6NK15_9PEZI|nr:protein AE7 [Diplogelasinospora grovesii]
MEKAALDNADPTILSVSQLPSRRQKNGAARHGPASKYDHLISPRQSGPWDLSSSVSSWSSDEDEGDEDLAIEPLDEQEIYDLISPISDPEHPHTLGQLSVVNLPDIHITPSRGNTLNTVLVELTPTVNHCSLATVIGLAVRVRLEKALPPNFRIDVRMKEGSHAQDDQVNKQLGDKERVAAALENDQLTRVLNKMMETCA